MKRLRIDRDDGRYVYLYAFDRALPDVFDVSAGAAADAHLELRWNALLAEHVIVSTGRQDRTFLPPAEHCPLCPTRDAAAFPTELPVADFEIAVFENRFTSLRADAPEVAGDSPMEQRAQAAGACEVVVYSQRHDGDLRSMPLSGGRHLVDVWADRYAELSARPEVKYVFIFENRGKEIGVTLGHPHGQIYAFPYVPPRVQQERNAAKEHFEYTWRCLGCDIVKAETAHGTRVIAEAPGFVAYVPFAARVPYEVHVRATGHRASLLQLRDIERDGLAAILRDVQAAYDALWGFAMPYTMSMHQGEDAAGDHLHIEFLPPYRSRDKLKYFAGVETGAGTYINDTSPEEKAAELRNAGSTSS